MSITPTQLPPICGTIYALVDPRTNLQHYIGRTTKILLRLTTHIRSRSTIRSPRFQHWLDELHSQSLEPLITLLEENIQLHKLNDREAFWIRHARHHNQPLVNYYTPGTDMRKPTYEPFKPIH